MLYTDQTKQAIKLCFEAHKDQVDKAGLPYFLHPVHLAEQVDPNAQDAEAVTCVALLHDVLEDTDISFEEIQGLGFNSEVMDALVLLNHDPAIPYLGYVERLSGNPIARQVKMPDLQHNMDLTRLDLLDEATFERLKKYRNAYEFLASHQDC